MDEKAPTKGPERGPARATVLGPVADARGLIPQPHGGALRPWTPARGAAAARSPIKSLRKESLALLAEATPAATTRLIELMQSTDDRVAAIAAAQILDRVHGRPSEVPQVAAEQHARHPADYYVSELSPVEREELIQAINTVRRLRAAGLARAEARGVIDG